MLSKKSQPLTVRRPIGLHGVARGNHSLGMCSNVHRPQLTGAWISAATFVVDDVVIVERHFAPIRRPRRIEACFGDLRDVTAVVIHHEYAAAISRRSESDARAVGRVSWLRIVTIVRRSQVNSRARADRLPVNVPISVL